MKKIVVVAVAVAAVICSGAIEPISGWIVAADVIDIIIRAHFNKK